MGLVNLFSAIISRILLDRCSTILPSSILYPLDTYQSYYHLFAKNELDDLVIATGEAEIMHTGYDRDNWYVIACKRQTQMQATSDKYVGDIEDTSPQL